MLPFKNRSMKPHKTFPCWTTTKRLKNTFFRACSCLFLLFPGILAFFLSLSVELSNHASEQLTNQPTNQPNAHSPKYCFFFSFLLLLIPSSNAGRFRQKLALRLALDTFVPPLGHINSPAAPKKRARLSVIRLFNMNMWDTWLVLLPFCVGHASFDLSDEHRNPIIEVKWFWAVNGSKMGEGDITWQQKMPGWFLLEHEDYKNGSEKRKTDPNRKWKWWQIKNVCYMFLFFFFKQFNI